MLIPWRCISCYWTGRVILIFWNLCDTSSAMTWGYRNTQCSELPVPFDTHLDVSIGRCCVLYWLAVRKGLVAAFTPLSKYAVSKLCGTVFVWMRWCSLWGIMMAIKHHHCLVACAAWVSVREYTCSVPGIEVLPFINRLLKCTKWSLKDNSLNFSPFAGLVWFYWTV